MLKKTKLSSKSFLKLLIPAAIFFLSICSARAQSLQNYYSQDNSNQPFTFLNPTIAGDLLVACQGTNPTTYAGAITGVPTLSNGTVMALVPSGSFTTSDGMVNQQCTYNGNIAGGAAPSITFHTANTVTGPTTQYPGAYYLEFTGVSGPWTADGPAVSSGVTSSSATSYTSPGITTNFANEILVCVMTQGAGTGGAFSSGGGSGWTGVAFGSQAISWRTASTAGTYTGCPATARAGTNDYVMMTMAFYVGSAPPVTTFYLSPTGNDGNPGTLASPWLTPNHNLPCGDVIQAAASTSYNGDYFTEGNWGTVTCGTGNSANVVWLTCITFDACKINSSDGNAFWIDKSFWGVKDWEVSNPTSNWCFLAAPNFGTPSEVHHVVFANDIANGCFSGGFGGTNTGNSSFAATASVDYLVIVGTISYNTAEGSGPSDATCGEGIAMFEPRASDALSGTHFFWAGNFVFDAVDNTGCNSGAPTDGEGIILDTFNYAFTPGGTPYPQQTVVENNMLLFNGGRGLLVGGGGNSAGTVYLLNNTVYANNSQAQAATICGEIATNVDSGTTFIQKNMAVTTGPTACGSQSWYAYGIQDSTSAVQISSGWSYSPSGQNCTAPSSAGFSCGSAVLTTTNPSFFNPVNPSSPSCGSFSTTVACMATVISNFTPTVGGAMSYGYQAPNGGTDSLFPLWLCNVNLPAGLINENCGSTPVPTISGTNIMSGPVTTPVIISGSNFGSSQGTSTVKFNGTTAIPTSWGASSITVPVPVGATSGNIIVNVGGNNSNGAVFTVTSSPAIWSMGYYTPFTSGGYPLLSTIQWSALTHILFVGGAPQSDGSVTLSSGFAAAATSLIAAAHSNGVSVLFSLTNVGSGTNFTSAVTNHESAFIANIMSTVNTYGFDGVDIDDEETWNATVITTMVSDLRTNLGSKLLTATGSESPWNSSTTPVCVPSSSGWTAAQVAYLNRLDLRTYGMVTTYEPQTWFNSPLYTPVGTTLDSTNWQVQAALNCGIPGAKIAIGIPFFGYLNTPNTGPYQSFGGSPSFTSKDYSAIIANYTTSGYTFDLIAQAPWIAVSGSSWLTWDTPYLVSEKTKYAAAMDIGGWFIKNLGADYIPAATPSTNPLLSAVVLTSGNGDPLALQYFPSIDENPNDYPSNVGVTDGMVKVQQQAGNPGSLKWFVGNAMKNEWTEFQIHEQVTGGSSLTLNATASNLIKTTGPGCSAGSCPGTPTINSANIILYMAGYYSVNSSGLSDLAGTTGVIPDVLIPKTDPYYHQATSYFPATVASGQNQSMWVDVLVPSTAASGYYCGTITVSNNGTTYAVLPVCVGVWDFALPSSSSLPSYYSSDRTSTCQAYYGGYSGCAVFPGAGGSSETAKSMTNLAYAVLLADHRISASESNYPWPDSGVANNWTAFDSFFGGILTGTTNSGQINPVMSGARLLNWDYNAHDGYVANIQNWMQHAITAGYPPPFNSICDESTCDSTTSVCLVSGGCGAPTTVNYLLARVNPYNCTNGGTGGVATWSGTSPFPQLTYAGCSNPPMAVLATRDIASATSGGYLSKTNILSPNIYSMWPYLGTDQRSSYNSWLAANVPAPGATLIMYQACSGHDYNSINCAPPPGTVPPIYPSPMIDASPVRNRVMQWMDYLENVQGDLYYSIDYCWYNSDCSSGTAPTTHGTDPWINRYYSGGNGDGTLLYPCTYAKVGTGASASWSPFPCPSIILKQLRDGFQDFEYLNKLKLLGYGSFATQTAQTFITNDWTIDESSPDLIWARSILGNKIHALLLNPVVVLPVPAPPTGLILNIR